MRLDQLELILYDQFQMDDCRPNRTRFRRECERLCYRQWAVDRLTRMLYQKFGAEDVIPLEQYVSAVRAFIRKTTAYSRKNAYGQFMFSTAAQLGREVLDVIQNMM